MYTIRKDFHFSASHQLLDLPADHQCRRLHGHNYRVRVMLAGPDLDSRGMIVDYGELAPFARWINETLDHRHLNEVIPDLCPTAENLARYLHDMLREALTFPAGVSVTVGVSETPTTWAYFHGD